MSSISGLFADAKTDSKLNDLFSSKSAGPVKRTIGERTVIDVNIKRSKKKVEQQEKVQSDEEDKETNENEEQEEEQPKPKKKKRSEDEEDDELESKYFEKILSKEDNVDEESKEEEKEESNESSDSEDEEATAPKAGAAAKKIDLKEDETEKAERTNFVGNLNSSVITSKKEYKAFKKLFLEFGEIDSIRFRSIAFNEALPRKVAFVQQKLHSSRDSVNAYVVFKTKESARKSLEANGKVFEGLHLRVDSVAHPARIDNNRTIFVGNLDFEEKEEELWSIFSESGEIESVRIVRDSKTNVGKGFGYVQFKDFTSVSKALLLNEKKLGAKKRKLRISRAKKVKKPTDSDRNPKGRHNKNDHSNLTVNQKTKLGRARSVLGKADRATAGNQIVEGTRAKKGDVAVGIKNGKNRVKKPRIRQRSTDFKNAQRGAK